MGQNLAYIYIYIYRLSNEMVRMQVYLSTLCWFLYLNDIVYVAAFSLSIDNKVSLRCHENNLGHPCGDSYCWRAIVNTFPLTDVALAIIRYLNNWTSWSDFTICR